VPLDTDEVAFVVVDPRELFADYAPRIAEDAAGRFPFLADEDRPLLLSIVVVRREWAGTTVNLRAPLIVSPRTMHGAQVPLADSPYRVDEPLPVADAA
ncbi:MAG: flagellar assembly protein FliW, partial [Pyrinomonadaceae bacterium]